MTGVLAAEVTGIDLCDVSDVELGELRSLICQHEVL
ncbi:MAG: hypothetical protein RL688_822, partial [Actinomycetota bacterium]